MQRTQPSFIKSLLHRWYSSFELLEPKELGILLLSSLNTVVRSSTTLLTHFSWWLFVWTAYIDLYIDGTGLFGHFWEYLTPLVWSLGFEPRLYLFSLMLTAFVMILSVRSSIEAKNWAYFIKYGRKLPFFILLFFALPHVYSVPLFWLATFFMLDGRLTLRSLGYSLYNGAVLNLMYAPFLLCLGAAHGVVYHLHHVLWECTALEEYYFAPYATKYTASLVLYLFFVAMLHTFYVRTVQSNSGNVWFKRG